ncbi:hypothetical protein DPMN_054675 [Dreissena polymorpha]|uniref:Uncharacterized protein n=1 Tax=Dreissena polymorpha TaxID=45954 RepID=A0A9D4CNJ8_DREPO|nr:hypothetical protein DPMN_054675 [Dreissena polymorpha]
MQSSLDCYLKEMMRTDSLALMRYEWARLKSFERFEAANVSVIRLAQNGLFYTGTRMTVQCFACGFQYNNWTNDSQVWMVHERLKPDCTFLSNTSASANVPIHSHGDRNDLTDNRTVYQGRGRKRKHKR